jgi:threonine/homoserine/homoserine lactone efflux protein
VTAIVGGDNIAKSSSQAGDRSGTMAGILFAVGIALGTLVCVGIVIWASEY